ncbi:BA14K family protein [Bosea sp. 117]|uniref:BA14K family protein n=1 Tax=Bosea sp. 117 TaxID=1125973 RepID=UPI000494AEE0|nr:BA14K family protein [Bosea sp. 117]
MKKTIAILAATLMAATPAAAASFGDGVLKTAPSGVEQVRHHGPYGGPYRHGGYYRHGYDRHYHGRYYRNDGAVAAGVVGGLLLGGAIAGAANANVARGATYADAHVQWCASQYRSYRAYDNTFQPYGGPRQPCVSPYN